MAASGSSLGQVLEAGEWRNAASLRHLDETICNCCAQHLTRVTMNEVR